MDPYSIIENNLYILKTATLLLPGKLYFEIEYSNSINNTYLKIIYSPARSLFKIYSLKNGYYFSNFSTIKILLNNSNNSTINQILLFYNYKEESNIYSLYPINGFSNFIKEYYILKLKQKQLYKLSRDPYILQGQTECAICIENFNDSPKNIRCELRDCGHVFHHTCMNDWKDSRNPDELVNCPVCRAKINELIIKNNNVKLITINYKIKNIINLLSTSIKIINTILDP